MNSSTINISEVQIALIKPRNGLVAFVSFVLDNAWYLGNIAVYTKLKGDYRLVYPTKKINDKNLPIMYPLNRDVGLVVEQKINQELNKLFDNFNNESN